MVVLALDVGEKRIGVAVSDPLGIVAVGLDVIERSTEGAEFERIAELAAERGVERIVVGMPLNMDGSVGRQAHRARGFMKQISKRLPQMPVEAVDERLSTAQAHRVLSQAGATDRVRRRSVDRMAAQIILTRYLLREASRSRDDDQAGQDAAT